MHKDIAPLHIRLKIVLHAKIMGQARSQANAVRPKMCLMLWIACAYDRTSLTMKNAYKGSKLLGMQITQLDNVDYAQKICGVMGMNYTLSFLWWQLLCFHIFKSKCVRCTDGSG